MEDYTYIICEVPQGSVSALVLFYVFLFNTTPLGGSLIFKISQWVESLKELQTD